MMLAEEHLSRSFINGGLLCQKWAQDTGITLTRQNMAVRKSPDGWVLFVFRRTKMCLGEAQALVGGSGGMLPQENFGKMEPNTAILCILAVKTEWLQHGPLTKSTQKL